MCKVVERLYMYLADSLGSRLVLVMVNSERKFPDINHLKISIQTLVEKLYVKPNFILSKSKGCSDEEIYHWFTM